MIRMIDMTQIREVTKGQNWSGFFSRHSVKTGTNAELAAPSPTKSLKRLGILKLTTNASAPRPVPKAAAITISRIKPSTRLRLVKPPMIPADLATDLFMS
jgi:hypothetical protein